MKILKTVLVVGLVVGLAAYAVLALCLDSLLVKGVNNYGPQFTQTKVTLKSASLSPLSGSGQLTGLVVGNPAGWSERDAMSLGRVQFDIEPMSVFGDTVVINELSIDAPEFNYETKIIASNLKDILANIEKVTGSKKEDRSETGPGKKFILKKFRLTNGKATVGLGPKAVSVTFPDVGIDDIGVPEGGITADQLSGVLLKKVLASIVSGASEALGVFDPARASITTEQLKDAAKNAGDALKKMFKEEK
jgi:hypothetical protein